MNGRADDAEVVIAGPIGGANEIGTLEAAQAIDQPPALALRHQLQVQIVEGLHPCVPLFSNAIHPAVRLKDLTGGEGRTVPEEPRGQ